MKKMWNGRFTKETDKLTDELNGSLKFDYQLLKYDIQGSIAHAKGLYEAKVLTQEELGTILKGLEVILNNENNTDFSQGDEDVHMLVERLLVEEIGEVGKKLHTARSRNDQVAVDTRMYLRKEVESLMKYLQHLIIELTKLEEKYKLDPMPGMTHLQNAQAITLGYWFNAYKQMFKRDLTRLKECHSRINVCPLGSGALSGISYNVNREYTASLLGFTRLSKNALDAVSDRDYVIETLHAISLIGIHFSRMAEEVIIYNSAQFNYIVLDDAFSTGSSIMPQKKNPDIAELTRGKSARLIGNLVQMLTLMKATPLAYNKDFQEDKEALFDSVNNIKLITITFTEMLKTSTFNLEKLKSDCQLGYLNATDLADYLVDKGIAFRDAHHIVGQIVAYAEANKISIDEIEFDNLQEFTALIDPDIYEYIKIENCIARRQSYGGVGHFISQ